MKIELYYEWNLLDKEPQFGLVIEIKEGYEIYSRWVYYYLGVYFGKQKPTLYPFKRKKLLKSYKYCNNAERQARLIYNRIQTKLKQHGKSQIKSMV